MSKAKHTPGPWKVLGTSLVFGGRKPRIGSFAVAQTFMAGEDGLPLTDEREQAANARLIAAAPDLLAACRWLRHVMSNDGGDCWCSIRDQPGAKVWVEGLKATIAKAEPT